MAKKKTIKKKKVENKNKNNMISTDFYEEYNCVLELKIKSVDAIATLIEAIQDFDGDDETGVMSELNIQLSEIHDRIIVS